MINNHRIVVVTPAGRKEYLEILIPYILRDSDIVDEYHLWANTDVTEDLNYIELMSKKYPNFIKVIYRDPSIPVPAARSLAIFQFFKTCIDENTIYIRLDDDIVFIEQDAIKKLALFRIENPKYFLVYGNIINNAICTHLHQRFGAVESEELATYDCTSPIGWANGEFAEFVHHNFIRKFKIRELDKFKFNVWELPYYERVSINVISWLGTEFNKFDGKVGNDEELWLSQIKPSEIKKMNCIYGQSLFSHYAFYTQRKYLEETSILQLYKHLVSFLAN